MDDDQSPNSETELTSTNNPQGCDDAMSCIATNVKQMSLLDDSQMEIDDDEQVTLGDQNMTVQGGNNNIHQDQRQMSDNSEESSSSADNGTSSGIGGEFSEEELSLVRWLQENVHYEISINPAESPLKGGAPCCFTFNPELHPDVSSGRATFKNLAIIGLLRPAIGFLMGTNIPASPVPGWVSVLIESQDGTPLGQTKIYYKDEEEEVLQKIVVSPSLQKRLFVKYNRYHSLGGNLETSGGEVQNSETLGFKQPVEMLSLLVYAAAERGAQQFIEMIFTSSAGRVVFDSYKDSSTLPEVIARDHGNEETAHYLEDITKRFSEEITIGQECSKTIDWPELVKAAEAAQKRLDQASEEDNCRIKPNVPKETGYLGDVDTSSSESLLPQSSDSEDDISTTLTKASISGQQCEIRLQRDLEERNTDTKDQLDVKEVKDGCPSSGSEEQNELQEMKTFSDLPEAVKQEDRKDLNELQVKTRKCMSKARDTVDSHRAAADKLDTVWKNSNTARAAGSISGIVGGMLTIGGGVATVMTGGAASPILLAGLASGVAGAGTTVVTSIIECSINSSEITKAEKDLKETLDSVDEVNNTVQVWLFEKEKRRLMYICYLADQTLKSSDPVVIDILRKLVVPSLASSATQVELAMLGALGWAAAQVVTTAVAKGGVEVGIQAAKGGIMQGVGQAGAQVAGKLMIGVSAVFVAWELIQLSYTIKNIVENKGSNAAKCLREKADELERSILKTST